MTKKTKHTTTKDVDDMLANYKGEHPSVKLQLLDWKRQHEDYYQSVKYRVEHGDLSIFEEVYALMQDCLPNSAKQFNDTIINGLNSDNADDEKKAYELLAPVVEIAQKLDKDKIAADMEPEQTALLNDATATLSADGEISHKDVKDFLTVMGPAYLIHCLSYMKEYLANLADVNKEGNLLLLSMLYLLIVDNGAPLFANAFIGIGGADCDSIDNALKQTGVNMLLDQSINLNYTRKKGWKERLKTFPITWTTKILARLMMIKGKSGHVRKVFLLEDIVPEKTDAVKRIIKEHLSQKDVPAVDIAYILLALQNVELVDKNTDYTTFHNAVQYFMKKDYFPNKALKAYTDIKKEKYYYKTAGNHNKHAQQTINMLAEKFEDC